MKKGKKIICCCGCKLEIKNLRVIKCLNCNRIYDDRGNLLGRKI